MTPGEDLKAYREAQGLTRQQLADISNVPFDTLRNWEDNRREMKQYHTDYFELLKESKRFKQFIRKLKKANQKK